MDRIDDGLEIKAGAGGDIAALFAEFSSAFEEFKATNDQRLGEIEKRGSADGLLEGKLERLNRVIDGHKAAMDRLSAERARPAIEGKGGDLPDGEYKEAFSAYVKRGEEKALQVGVNADGGYVVPGEVESEITRLMTHISPIRAISGVRQVSGSVYKRPITVTGPQTGWVGEAASRPTTTSQTLAELSYPTTELYAMPAATATLPGLDDPADDLSVSCVPNALVLFNPVYDNGPDGYGYDRVKERWQEISPLHNIREGIPPAIVFLGTKDRLIPVATGKAFQKKMEDVGSRSELMLWEGAEHGFFNPGKGDGTAYHETVAAMDRFLTELGYLKPAE